MAGDQGTGLSREAVVFVPVRLRPGDDLRKALEAAVTPGESAFVVAGIGSLTAANLRFADRTEPQAVPGPLEIVSLSGTLTPDGAHLHMTVSDDDGRVTGGHVGRGNIIRTTAEILLAPLPDWSLGRAPDPGTGYDELVVRRRDGGN